MFARFRTLRARLMVAFALMMALTVLLVGIPSVYLIDQELSRQVEARLAQGASASRALFDAEVREMRDLVTLTSERPTLRRLLIESNRAELGPYLATIQETAGLSHIAVADANGAIVVQLPPTDTFPVRTGESTPHANFVAHLTDTGEWTIALEGGAPILAPDDTLLGYIYEVHRLDEPFLNELFQETGLYHNLVLQERNLLGTLFSPNGVIADAPLQYYTRRLPLIEHSQGTIEDMLALPKAEVNSARNRLLQLLAAITIVVTAGSAGLGYLLARRVTAPLKGLVHASAGLGRGDLATPIVVEGEVTEVESLATTLEQMRKRVRDAYQSVEQSNIWHENLLASLTEGVITVDQAGNLTSFSAGASRISGWTADEVIGRHYTVVFPPPTPETAQEGTPLYTTPGTVTRQTTRTQADELITLRVTSGERTQRTDEGWEQAYVIRNVTEEEQAIRLREFLLANVSHEFKTPLAALHAAVELLATELPTLSRPEVEQLIDSIWQGTLRLDELVENLIGSAGLQTGHFPISLRSTDLDGVIEEVLLMSRPLLALRGQYLKVDAPSPLRFVQADARRLHQVFINLISNASKYGKANAPILLTVVEGEKETVVKVTDMGKGVPSELRPYLFRPFARQSTPDRNGIGLGLSIVKAIVERHGGQVGMEDAPQGGTTFWFSLPTV